MKRVIETLRHEYNTLKAALDEGKLALYLLNEARKGLDEDPEFNAIFVLKEAECNYYITEAEERLELLKKEIDRLEAHHRDN